MPTKLLRYLQRTRKRQRHSLNKLLLIAIRVRIVPLNDADKITRIFAKDKKEAKKLSSLDYFIMVVVF